MDDRTPRPVPAIPADPADPAGGAVRDDLLVVDDLFLLLLDDDGASIQAAGTLYYTLGGAVLTELALLGRVEVDDTGVLNGPRVTPAGDEPLPDPLLQAAFDTVAAKTQRVQPLLVALGADLWREVMERLVARGLVRQEERTVLGLFRTTRWPAADAEHEARLRARVRRVLEDGEAPDARTAAIVGLLSASGALPSLRPPLPWNAVTAARAQELQRGQWGPEAVATAVARTAAAITASTAAAAVAAAAAAGR
ncbi:GPP34 family phosphoprotein [Sphaerisporangium cinnabarinum]|nr:GPP34 family phosphoprotein [Sphaerisporangium cinnabarinum]PTU55562.1 GPP34 family phosphoprotein [Sphaerisporangium cinnabarinum]